MQKIGIIAAYKKESIDQINRVAFDYVSAIEKAGALPYIIPCNVRDIIPYISDMDGFVFPGGGDIDPSLYHESNTGSQDTYPQMDAFFISALDAVIKSKKKVLGICRGMQLINIYYGGKLIQDISNAGEHNQYERQYEVIDTGIVQDADSFLGKAFGSTEIPINSLHHQAVSELGEGLKIAAVSKFDNTIEAIQHQELPIFGVQWHPECVETNAVLFEWFVKL